MLYLSSGGVSGRGARRGGFAHAVRAVRGQSAAALRLAETLPVFFTHLQECEGKKVTSGINGVREKRLRRTVDRE